MHIVELPACFSLRLRDGRLHHSPSLTLPTGCVSCTFPTRHAKDCSARIYGPLRAAAAESAHSLGFNFFFFLLFIQTCTFLSSINEVCVTFSWITLHALLQTFRSNFFYSYFLGGKLAQSWHWQSKPHLPVYLPTSSQDLKSNPDSSSIRKKN